MNVIIDAAIAHSRTVLLILVLLLIAGVYTYVAIPKEAEPDIPIPFIYVSMHHTGISPGDAERLLIRPMEQELNGIEGVKKMTSNGYQDGGNVLLEFVAGFDVDTALDDVREAVDRAKPDLPEDTDEPVITEVNFSLFPVLVVTLSGAVPDRTLYRLAEDLQDKVEAINTVLEAKISGKREEVVEIIIDPVLIENYNLDASEIGRIFRRNNILVAAGNLDNGSGRFAVKVPGLFRSADEMMNMPLLVRDDSVIRVRDIATLSRTYKDPENFARMNGKKAVVLEVVKRSGENVIETIEAVKQVVAQERKYWPPTVQVTYTQDKSKQIRDMLRDLQNNVISAILLVMIVCIAALGLRAAGLVGVSIPGAFLTGLLVLYLMGLTVNIVVLFSLILSVGILVDGAIVVTEYADREMCEGRDRKTAYATASKRMSWPIIASTATTLAAFLPLLFWPGIVGEFMKYLPVTLIAVLCASLLMALIFVPTLGALVGKPGAAQDPVIRRMAEGNWGKLDDVPGLTGKYLRFLNRALDMPGRVLLLAVAALIGVQMLYGHIGKGVIFFPDVEPENAMVLIHARGNLSIHEQDAIVREVEDIVLQSKGVHAYYTRTGSQGGTSSQGQEMAEDVIGVIQMEFEDWDKRPKASTIMDDIRRRTAAVPGVEIEIRKEESGPSAGKDIQIEVAARNPALLAPAVGQIREGLETKIKGLVDIEDSRPLPGIEWEFQIDRAQATKFSLDVSAVGDAIRMVTNGLKMGEYRPDDSDDELDILVRHSREQRTVDQLDQVRIVTPDGSVPISNFVKRVPKPLVGTLTRVDQNRVMSVKANVAEGGNTDAKVKEISKWLEDSGIISPDLQVTFRGEDEDQKEAQAFLIKAFIVALFLMAIILVTQFNSFYSALLILSAVIMSTIGVMLGLLITGQPFGIVMTGIGVIALAGIIVNNNIVLIDTYDYIMKTEKLSVREAVLRTGGQRLRPVLLTTVTTALGLMPMVLTMNIDFFTREVSIGAPSTQWWVSLSTAVVFGLVFSTALTLVVTPCALMMREEAGRAWDWVKAKFRHEPQPEEKHAGA